MQGYTLAITLVGSLVVLFSRHATGLATLVAVMLGYPSYLRLSIGTLDLSPGRIIVVVLLARVLLDGRLVSRFRWCLLDTLVLLDWGVTTAAMLMTTDYGRVIEYRGGVAMDTVLCYWAARLIMIDRPAMVRLMKIVSLVVLPLAVAGVIEAVTGVGPYQHLTQFRPYETLASVTGKGDYEARLGLHRAMGPASHPIMFGLSFVTFLPLIALLRYEASGWRLLVAPFVVAAGLGCMSSMSSGPWLALAVAVICLVLERAKYMVKPILFLGMAIGLLIEIMTRKHFYYVLARLSLDADNGWYRARLVDVAISHLPEYWLAGYGLRDPGWGPEIQHAEVTDIVNHYVLVAVQGGVFGLLAFMCVLVGSMWMLCRCYSCSRSPWVRSATWAVGTVLVILMVVFWCVSLFGTMMSYLYITIGLSAALCQMATRLQIPKPKDVTRKSANA